MKAAEKCYRIENKKRGVKRDTKQTRGQFQGGINLLFPSIQDIRINEPYGSKGLMSCLFLRQKWTNVIISKIKEVREEANYTKMIAKLF